MSAINITNARKELYSLVEDVNRSEERRVRERV